jgi:UDP:flavonoid glycosyltransferase YjiC (YdhE family)
MESVEEAPIHILLVSFPGQGHINPILRLGKCLAAKGVSVIFTTTENAGKGMRAVNNITNKLATPIGNGSLIFEFFDDGLPENVRPLHHMQELEVAGRKFVSEMIKNHANSNKPISCIINNPFLPWVCDVAFEHNIPSALSWIHSTAVFATYYNYVQKVVPYPSKQEPYIDVQLNSSIVLKYNEIPDFIHPFCPYPLLGTLTSEQFKDLSKVFCVLVDSYEELERDLIDYLSKKSVLIRPIGPLFMNPTIKEASNIRGDFGKSNGDDNVIEWLNTKPKGSVVYISFGTIVDHPQEQWNEIAYGLLNSQVTFLWAKKTIFFQMGF